MSHRAVSARELLQAHPEGFVGTLAVSVLIGSRHVLWVSTAWEDGTLCLLCPLKRYKEVKCEMAST